MEIVKNIDELEQHAQKFIDLLERPEAAHIVQLFGDLGVGKTAFVKACAKALGIDEDITSPTFVIQKEYPISGNSRFSRLVHIDAYRLESASELEYLGWEELIADSKTLICIEWPEQVAGIALPGAIEVSLSILSDTSRALEIKK